MKGLTRLGLLGLFALCACEGRQLPTPVQLTGTYDLAYSGDLLFVTSANRNELRVLDLSTEPRMFVRAPNPVEPLAIPVVDRPSGLTTDRRWDEEGQSQAGAFVFVRSAGSEEISVVSAARDDLVEVARVRVGGGTLASPEGPVTAFAARTLSDGRAVLYYAVFSSGEGTLRQVIVPTAEALKADPNQDLAPTDRVLSVLPGEAVTALLVLPGPAGADETTTGRLAVATRSFTGPGGRTVLVETQGTAAGVASTVVRTLDFPAPVRELRTHGRTPGDVPGLPVLAEAQRIFGVLDESTCQGADLCRGIVAVDTATGQVSIDESGVPMRPIRFDDTLITGFELGVDVPVANLPVSEFPLVGFVSTSDGRITFFDAVGLRPFDLDTEGARVGEVEYRNVGEREAGASGPGAFVLGNGKVRDEELQVVYQGVLPNLEDVPVQGTTFAVPPAPGEALELGDAVQVVGADDCQAELSVSALTPGVHGSPTTPEVPTTFEVQGDAGGCTGFTRFTVRAAGARPYVVVASESGFLGRVGPGETFVYAGAVLAQPEGFDPAAPALTFVMGPQDPQIARDDRYVVGLENGFTPYSFTIDEDFGQVHLPMALVFAAQFNRLFVAFPSGDTLVEVDPQSVTPSQANVVNVVSYQ